MKLDEGIHHLVRTLTGKGTVEPDVFLAVPIKSVSALDDDVKAQFGELSILVPSTPMNGVPYIIQENHSKEYVEHLWLHASGALVPAPLRDVVPTMPYHAPVGVLIQYRAPVEAPKKREHHG